MAPLAFCSRGLDQRCFTLSIMLRTATSRASAKAPSIRTSVVANIPIRSSGGSRSVLAAAAFLRDITLSAEGAALWVARETI